MTRPTRLKLVLLRTILAVLVACLGPQPLFAQAAPSAANRPAKTAPTSPPPMAETLTGTARVDYEAARILFENEDYEAALVKLQEAYKLSSDPRLLWNMAACEKNLRHYSKVQSLIQQYLREGSGVLTPENERDAKDLLDAVKTFVSTLHIRVSEGEAQVFLDDDALGTSPLPGPVTVDVGEKTLRVVKPDFKEYARKVTIKGGASVHVDVKLDPMTCRLVVATQDSATVWIDNKAVGKGRWEGVVSPGLHTIRVTAPDMKVYQADLEVKPGTVRTLQVSLETNKTDQSIWPWVAGGAALVIGGGIASYLIFRPKDPGAEIPAGKLPPHTLQMPLLGTW